MSRVTNAVTVDVEDYFQVQAFAGVVSPSQWDGMPQRVADSTCRVLDALARAGVRGTFFTLGWVAERHPALVRRIVADGHELASHGFMHQRVDGQTPAVFAADVARSRAVLEQLGGVAVRGYRAPTFSITARSSWAYQVLADAGFAYSSSIYPVRHDLYGSPDAPRQPYRPDGSGVWELPMTTARIGGRNLPCSGGGYFRLLPYAAFRSLLRRSNNADARAGIFYTHPWEFDPGQPRVQGIPALARFRHYVNLSRTAARFDRLLRDFAWDRIDAVYAELLDPARGAGLPRAA